MKEKMMADYFFRSEIRTKRGPKGSDSIENPCQTILLTGIRGDSRIEWRLNLQGGRSMPRLPRYVLPGQP